MQKNPMAGGPLVASYLCKSKKNKERILRSVSEDNEARKRRGDSRVPGEKHSEPRLDSLGGKLTTSARRSLNTAIYGRNAPGKVSRHCPIAYLRIICRTRNSSPFDRHNGSWRA